MRSGQVLIGHLAPLTSPDTNKALAEKGVTAFAMEAIPRITRAQAMDALSSQANVTGYAATLLAAREAGRFFPMMTTAAGTVAPAKVMVLGAGVAGLQAIATAKRLGAVVTGFDIRRAAWEQIASLGGRPWSSTSSRTQRRRAGTRAAHRSRERAGPRRPGRRGGAPGRDHHDRARSRGGRPLLITAEAVRGMHAGSVIVDLAGESGGNCELSTAGETVIENGVKVIAPLNLAERDGHPRVTALCQERREPARAAGLRGGPS